MPSKTFDLSIIMKMIDRFSAPLKQSALNINKWIKKTKEAKSATKEFGQNLRNLSGSVTGVGRKLSLGLTVPITALNVAVVKTAIDFESAFTGVRKTVEATEPVLLGLREELKALAIQIPLSTEEVFGIGEAAGQLGIETKNIVGFAKVMADLGATTNMSADQAATSLARLANITGMPQEQFDRLGSTIVHLGNNLATTEAEIVNMGLRLAGAGNLIGLTEAQILGMAGALSSLGVRTEAGGTAFSQVMRKIDKEVGTGSEIMAGFAAISGESVGKFEKLWKEDAMSALQLFIKGIGDLEEKGINVNQVLDLLGLDGMRVADSLLRAASNSEKFTESINLGSVAWGKNAALAREAALRYATMASQLKILWNNVKQLADSFGKELFPELEKMKDILMPIIDWFKDLPPEIKKTILVFGGLIAALGPLLVLIGAVMAAIAAGFITGPVAASIAAIAAGFVLISAAVATTIGHLDMFKKTFGPMLKEMKIFLDYLGEIRGFVSSGGVGGFVVRKAISGVENFRARDVSPQLGGSNRSQTDVNIKVSSDSGSTAQIEGVRSKGGSNVKVMNESHLGMNLFQGH